MKNLSNQQLLFLLESFNTMIDDGQFVREEDHNHIVEGLKTIFKSEIESRGFKDEEEFHSSYKIFDFEETKWRWR